MLLLSPEQRRYTMPSTRQKEFKAVMSSVLPVMGKFLKHPPRALEEPNKVLSNYQELRIYYMGEIVTTTPINESTPVDCIAPLDECRIPVIYSNIFWIQ